MPIELRDGIIIALINHGSGTCLDLAKGSTKSGTKVCGLEYKESPNQHWKLVQVPSSEGKFRVWPVWQLVNVQGGTALDLFRGRHEDGTSVIAWERKKEQALETSNQLWRFISGDRNSDIFMLQNASSGTYLDLLLGDSKAGDEISGWAGSPHLDNASQLWQVRVVATKKRKRRESGGAAAVIPGGEAAAAGENMDLSS